MRQRYGAPYWVAHRADLQRILLDAVRSQPAIRLVMGRSVEEVADGPDGASLTFVTASGARETLAVDAIIGADGLWSTHAGEPRGDRPADLSRLHRVAGHDRARQGSRRTGR